MASPCPGTPSPIAEKQRSVFSGCDVESKNVAVVKFTKIFHNPQMRLGFAVLPKHVFQSTAITPENPFANQPTGTGALKGSKGRRGVTFEKFKNGHHDAKVDGMTLQEGSDPLLQVRTLINNGVQGIVAVPPGSRADVSASDELTLKGYDLRSWWFVAVNQDKAYLKDKRARQGLNLVLDRTQLREKAIGSATHLVSSSRVHLFKPAPITTAPLRPALARTWTRPRSSSLTPA